MPQSEIPALQWPGVFNERTIAGSSGEITIFHGRIESPGYSEIQTSLPDAHLLICVHLSGSIWFENDSHFTSFRREGAANSANLGISGFDYTIRYKSEGCQYARFLMSTSLFERALEDGRDLHSVSFIDPQNSIEPRLGQIAKRTLQLSEAIPTNRLLADSIGYQLAAEILESWTSLRGQSASSRPRPQADAKRMSDVRDYIEARLTESLSLKELADISGLSVPQFMRTFKATFGMPPYRWIMCQKIERAKQLIGEGSMNMTEIAFSLDFSSLQHFSSVFRKMSGGAPSDYRATQKNAGTRSYPVS